MSLETRSRRERSKGHDIRSNGRMQQRRLSAFGTEYPGIALIAVDKNEPLVQRDQ